MSTRWVVIAAGVALAGGCTKGDSPAPQKASAGPEAAAPPAKPAPAQPAAGAESKNGARTWTFDEDSVDAIPAGVRPAETGGVGTPATWAIVARDDAPSPPHAFGVTATQNTGHVYNVALWGDTAVADVDLQVMVHAVDGKQDQGGGVVWRAKDADNYYLARWNPIENNVRFYVVLAGHRSTLAKADVDLDPGRWHELRVVAQGKSLQCFLDDEPVMQIEDESLTGAGAIGLWTKADAATLFDDLSLAAP